MDRMSSIVTFVKIAEAGSFAAAARKFGARLSIRHCPDQDNAPACIPLSESHL
jgi:hypothetical protein